MFNYSWSFSSFALATFILASCFLFQLATTLLPPPTTANQFGLPFKRPFSIKISIERFRKSNGFHEASLRLHERYSSPEESRAGVELENIYQPFGSYLASRRSHRSRSRQPIDEEDEGHERTGNDSALRDLKSYYYDGNTNQWLKLKGAECSIPVGGSGQGGPSQDELNDELFGDALGDFVASKLLLNEEAAGGPGKHLIGAAKLLLLLKQLGPQLVVVQGEPTKIRGVEVSVRRLELNEEDRFAEFNLMVAYRQQPGPLKSPFRRRKQQQHLSEFIPWHLEIGFGDSLLIVNFYDYKLLDELTSFEQITKSQSSMSSREELAFVFPLEFGCASALLDGADPKQQDQRERDPLIAFGPSISKVSFKAKIRDNLNGNKRAASMVFAFDLRAQLVRKDSIDEQGGDLGEEDFESEQAILATTLYDFEQNKKYHSFRRRKSRGNSVVRQDKEQHSDVAELNRSTLRAVHLASSSSSPAESGCFVSEIKATTSGGDKIIISNNQLSKFIHFERLIFMGRSRSLVNGVAAKVYVDEGLDRLPFWLAPSVVLKRANEEPVNSGDYDTEDRLANVTKLDSYQFESISADSGRIMLIYYFADDTNERTKSNNNNNDGDDNDGDESSLSKLGQLLRLEVLVKEGLRDILIFSQTIEFWDFSWNRLAAISSGRKSLNVFSLSRICSSPSAGFGGGGGATRGLPSGKLDFIMQLEPEPRVLCKEDFEAVEQSLKNQLLRNEIVIEALEEEFRMPKVYVDQVGSKLLQNSIRTKEKRRQEEKNQEEASSIRLPSMEFDVRVANLEQSDRLKLQEIHWVSLGLGQFMDQSQVKRRPALTMEECLWFAHHYSQLLGEEVLFSYKQTSKNSGAKLQECLMDRLYKWRDLQHHEAKIADQSKVKSLNYFAYEFGEFPMFCVSYSRRLEGADGPIDARLRTSLLLNAKPLSLIGRRLSLSIRGKDAQELEVQFVLKHLTVVGSVLEFLAAPEGGATATATATTTTAAQPTTARLSARIIDRVAWHPSSLVDQEGQLSGLIRSPSSPAYSGTLLNNLASQALAESAKHNDRSSSSVGDLQPLMTLPLCKLMCQLDIECKSYSYCDTSTNQADDCKLSLIDLEFGQVGELIREQVNRLGTESGPKRINRRQPPTRRILIGLGGEGDKTTTIEVSVRMAARCAIYSKSYGDLFAKSPSKELVPMELVRQQQQQVAVRDADECARRCFEKNLHYSRGLIEHKLNLTLVESEISRMKLEEHERNGVVSEQKLESLFDWHTRNLKGLCVFFYYSGAKSSKDTNQSTAANPSCLLSTDLGQQQQQQQQQLAGLPAASADAAEAAKRMDLHKLIYANLFERMSGFRLAETLESWPKESAQRVAGGESSQPTSSLDSYKLLLVSHQLGINRQVQVDLDDIEYCARACILQTHGPRPACSSFDFVYERRRPKGDGAASESAAGQAHKYCLLNSQSLHDLNRHSRRKGNSQPNGTLTGFLSTNSQFVFAENKDQYWHFEPRDSLLKPTIGDRGGGSEAQTNAEETSEEELDKAWFEFLDKNLVLDKNRMTKLVQLENSDESAFLKRISIFLMSTVFGIASGLFFGIKLAQIWIRRTRNKSEEANFMSRLVHRLSGVSISSRLQEGEVWM